MISQKSRLVTLLFSIFLGLIGVHRFYAGKVGTGIVMLLTFGGFGLWAFIDMIMIAAGTFRDIEGKFIKDWQV